MAVSSFSQPALGTDWITADTIPDTIGRLIETQITYIIDEAPNKIVRAIEYIAASPKPLKKDLLQCLVGDDFSSFIPELKDLGIVTYEEVNESFRISPAIARDVLVERLGTRNQLLIQEILKVARSQSDPDDLLLTLLLDTVSDYNGLVELLENETVMQNLNRTQDLNSTMSRMHTASLMACESENIQEVLRWSRGISSTQSLMNHAINSREISALIAIGEYQEALLKIYSWPESISKIRLLGKTYSAMKSNGESIPKPAIEELNVLINIQRIENLEKDVAQGLAVDILGILPDKAVEILAKSFREGEKQDIIDHALVYQAIISDEQPDDDLLSEIQDPDLGYFTRVYSSWLRGLSLLALQEEYLPLESTKAKEFMLRQWCRQNQDNPDLPVGISLWCDIVIGDVDYVISLSSLRRMSAYTLNVDPSLIRGLIHRLEIPTYHSLSSPREEWVGYLLNLAEAVHKVDPDESKKRIDEIYETINLEITDEDVKVFCYARLWSTASKIYPNIKDDIQRNFERVLSHLLDHSAFQYEILAKTLRILAGVDVKLALETGSRLNTHDRRKQAIEDVLISGYRKNEDRDLTPELEIGLERLEVHQRWQLITKLTYGLWQRGTKLIIQNQETLLNHVRKIPSTALRAEALCNLSIIWTHKKMIRTSKLVDECIREWRKIADLRVRIFLGFEIAERISETDSEAARKICTDVQRLLLQPGADLAAGNLGATYKKSIELAIQSLNISSISDQETLTRLIIDDILRLPSPYVQILLFADLAARAYSVGYHPFANEIISGYIIPGIESFEEIYQRQSGLEYCLPIIYKYHKEKAEDLAKNLPYEIRNRAWYFTVIWQITLGPLHKAINYEHVKIACNDPIYREYAIQALENISEDSRIHMSVHVITKSIEQSVIAKKVDGMAADDLLKQLEKLINSKLPDKDNIQHTGYSIITRARILGARSIIYQRLPRKGSLSARDLRKAWRSLDQDSRTVPNHADRVFVMNLVAKECYNYDPSRAEILLDDADHQIDAIPSIIDRVDRLEEIATTYGLWGMKTQAKYLIDRQMELLNELDEFSRDEKLEILVQAVYEFDPDLADEIASRHFSRFPERAVDPLKVILETRKLESSPGRIKALDQSEEFEIMQEEILRNSARKLYSDLIIGNGHIPSDDDLLIWAKRSLHLSETGNVDVLLWLSECLNRGGSTAKSLMLSEYYIDSTELIYKYAKWSSPARQEGFPDEYISYMPGLSSRIEAFKVGERDRAKKWIVEWIRVNSEDYLKIVDPYFGPSDLEFLSEAPKECKILIIATDKKFRNLSADEVENKLQDEWRLIGKGRIPRIRLLIVPDKVEDQFHDRAIISRNHGLNIGQSLNGLGKKIGNVIDLDFDTAKELEHKYIDTMLSENSWFIDHDIQPLTVTIS